MITVHIQNEKTGKYFMPMFVKRMHIPVNCAMIPHKYVNTNDGQDAMMSSINWKVYSDFLVPRIQFVEVDGDLAPTIEKKRRDKFTELVMEKPSNMAAPNGEGGEK